jgi:hypothetical protein
MPLRLVATQGAQLGAAVIWIREPVEQPQGGERQGFERR